MADSNTRNNPAVEPERLAPQSLDAERSALGSMILDRDEIGEVIQILDRDCFYQSDHQILFETIRDLYDQQKPLDLVLLREELNRRGKLEPGSAAKAHIHFHSDRLSRLPGQGRSRGNPRRRRTPNL